MRGAGGWGRLTAMSRAPEASCAWKLESSNPWTKKRMREASSRMSLANKGARRYSRTSTMPIRNTAAEVRGSKRVFPIAKASWSSIVCTAGPSSVALAVGIISRPARTNNVSPISFRSRASAWLAAGWDRNTRCAARVTLRSAIMASNTRRRFRSKFDIFILCILTMMRMHFHYARPGGMLLAMVIATLDRNTRKVTQERAHRQRLPLSPRFKPGRFSDFAVVARQDPGDRQVGPSGLVESLVLTSGRPTIVLPPRCTATPIRRILVGWNAGREATRAVADALPLLVRADAVEIFVVDRDGHFAGHGEEP